MEKFLRAYHPDITISESNTSAGEDISAVADFVRLEKDENTGTNWPSRNPAPSGMTIALWGAPRETTLRPACVHPESMGHAPPGKPRLTVRLFKREHAAWNSLT